MNAASIHMPGNSQPAIDWGMVKRLIFKDWYLHRLPISMCILGGLASLAIIATGSQAAFTIGVILLVTVLVASAAILATNMMVLERKEQTLPFVMSLPISYREYTAAKILGMVLIFLIPWLVITLGSFALIAMAPKIYGFTPFVAIMSVEILVNTAVIAAVALITESQGWTISAIMVGNLALNIIGYAIAHIPSIARGIVGNTVSWTPAATTILAIEAATLLLLLGVTFFIQSRKKDFI